MERRDSLTALGDLRGFSNEESIHTAPIQLTLSANPPPPLPLDPPFFLLSSPSVYPVLRASLLSGGPFGSRLRRAQRRQNLFYAPERGRVRDLSSPPPPFLLLTFPFNPFIVESLFIKTKIQIFQELPSTRRVFANSRSPDSRDTDYQGD